MTNLALKALKFDEIKDIFEVENNLITLDNEDYKVQYKLFHELTKSEKIICFVLIKPSEKIDKNGKPIPEVLTLSYKKENITDYMMQNIIKNSITYGYSLYMSIANFYAYRRLQDNAYGIKNIVLDLDWYGQDPEQAKTEIFDFTVKNLGIEPTAICYSGNGYYIVFNLENNIALQNKYIKVLYKKLLQKLIDLYKPQFNADTACTDFSRIFRMMSSVNNKTGNTAKILYLNESNKINFSDLATKLGFEKKEKYVSKKNEKIQVKKVKQTNLYSFVANVAGKDTKILKDRIDDLNKLFELRNYNLGDCNCRNKYLHLMSVTLCYLGSTADELANILYDTNELLDEPLPDSEIEGLLTSAAKNYEKFLTCGEYSHYRYKNEKIVKLLDITPSEQKHMKQLMEDPEKLTRKQLRDKNTCEKRKANNKTDKIEREANTVAQIKLLLMDKLTYSDIAGRLKISAKTVSRYAKKITAL